MSRNPASNELALSPEQFFAYPIWIRQNPPPSVSALPSVRPFGAGMLSL
jgi:hypothetical protein